MCPIPKSRMFPLIASSSIEKIKLPRILARKFKYQDEVKSNQRADKIQDFNLF